MRKYEFGVLHIYRKIDRAELVSSTITMPGGMKTVTREFNCSDPGTILSTLSSEGWQIVHVVTGVEGECWLQREIEGGDNG